MSKKKIWKILDGTYKKPIDANDVNRLIAGIQQEIYLDERDIETMDAIDQGKINWSGDGPKK
jgi:hypothetical protein|tara:strand:+ start:61 stop:246 length:186 start_codon:yes stop_codon:yes gene_type:complete